MLGIPRGERQESPCSSLVIELRRMAGCAHVAPRMSDGASRARTHYGHCIFHAAYCYYSALHSRFHTSMHSWPSLRYEVL